MRYLLLICLLAMTAVSPLAVQATCGLKNRLPSGTSGRVIPGPVNNVRETASLAGELVGSLEGGKAFSVTSDALCADGITWLPIQYTTRAGFMQGWTAESDASVYFLEPVSGTVIAGYGVTAIMPEGIAETAEITLHEKEDEAEDWTLPEYVQITFTGYEDEGDNLSDHGTITIYRTDAVPIGIDYNMWEGSFRHTIDELFNILIDRPDLEEFEPIYKRLPLFEVASATNLLAYRDYLAFQNGEGYHSLASSGQRIAEPTNKSLKYSYVGLTTDGQYFVHVDLPINAIALPRESVPAADLDSEEMREYLLRNGHFFDTLTPESYTPSLVLLDEFVNSLYIGD